MRYSGHWTWSQISELKSERSSFTMHCGPYLPWRRCWRWRLPVRQWACSCGPEPGRWPWLNSSTHRGCHCVYLLKYMHECLGNNHSDPTWSLQNLILTRFMDKHLSHASSSRTPALLHRISIPPKVSTVFCKAAWRHKETQQLSQVQIICTSLPVFYLVWRLSKLHHVYWNVSM